MRRLFIVLAKLAGFLQLYWALAYTLEVIDSILPFIEHPENGQGLINFIGIPFYLVMVFGMSWVLLARTEWLADRLKIREEGEIGNIDPKSVLFVGVKLIGIYVLVFTIPVLSE